MNETRTSGDSQPASKSAAPDDLVWSTPVVADYLQWLDPETSRSVKAAAQAAVPVPAPTSASGLWRPEASRPVQAGVPGLWRPDASGPVQADVSRPSRPTTSVPLTGDDASVSLARLMSSAVPIEWHHAVALVR